MRKFSPLLFKMMVEQLLAIGPTKFQSSAIECYLFLHFYFFITVHQIWKIRNKILLKNNHTSKTLSFHSDRHIRFFWSQFNTFQSNRSVTSKLVYFILEKKKRRRVRTCIATIKHLPHVRRDDYRFIPPRFFGEYILFFHDLSRSNRSSAVSV